MKYHRASYLSAFPKRVGGEHFCQIGDGDYAAVSGWPSMTLTQQGDYPDLFHQMAVTFWPNSPDPADRS